MRNKLKFYKQCLFFPYSKIINDTNYSKSIFEHERIRCKSRKTKNEKEKVKYS